MRFLFLVNEVAGIVARQTTTLLLMAAAREHEVFVCGVSDLSWSSHGGLRALALRVPASDQKKARVVAALRQRTPRRIEVESCDAVVIRTNPGRAGDQLASHDVALHFLAGAAGRGLMVVNDPVTLRRAATKVYLTELPPEVVPRHIVSRDLKEITAWLDALEGPAVVKPVRGTRGQGVFLVDEARSNLAPIIEVIQAGGYVMAQAFAEGGEQGDVRVVAVDGEVLEIDGGPAAIARVPASRDFRSNLAAGGRAELGIVDEAKRATLARIADKLREDGLFYVGVDFIGDQIIELNVFSPGGLGSASEHQGHDFAGAVMAAVEREHRRRAP